MERIYPFSYQLVGGPHFVAVEQGANEGAFADSHLSLHSQFRVCPHLFGELSDCCSGFPDLPINLSVEQKDVGDCRPKVGRQPLACSCH